MAPVKKQKPQKSNKKDKKVDEEIKTANESVISGQLQKKINNTQLKPKKDPRGVVFIKHLPHGFFEEQLKKYFDQFGNVTRVRLARSRRTGMSKGFAFVEFEYPEVAEVAAETMNNYLMFKKIIKAAYIPPEKQQFNYFRTNVKQIKNKSGRIVWVSGTTASIQQKAKQHNDWSKDKFQARTVKQMEKLKKMGEKFAHLGVDINKIIVPPKVVTEKKQTSKDKIKKIKTEEGKAAGGSKALKRKSIKEEKTSLSKKDTNKKSKKIVALEDLLGNTIQEDSDDEDYIAMPDSGEEEENEESSDEETYGFKKDSDTNDEEDKNDGDESEEDEGKAPVPLVNLKKSKKSSFGKSLNPSNIERFDQMLKRKPHTGGIQKLNKKTSKKSAKLTKDKGTLQLTAAKEMAKPLSKIKGKSVKHSKIAKKVK